MSITIKDLTVNYLTNPIGIDEIPRFSWKLTQDGRGNRQRSYRIKVMTGGKMVWDSKNVKGDECILIEYKGRKLMPRTTYRWNVSITDKTGERAQSEDAFFDTGKLDEAWTGSYIQSGYKLPRELMASSPYLRKRFNVTNDVSKAMLYIAGAGFFEPYINGKKINDHIMDPPYTAYDKTLLYYTFNVTECLRKGSNMLGVILGNGFFNLPTTDQWNTQAASWKSSPKMICELHITTKDNKQVCIPSDITWESHMSPITFNSLRNGEYYDARLEIPSWCDPDAIADDWANASISRDPGGILRANEIPSIKQDKEYPAINVKNVAKNTYLFDFGQNLAGFVRIKVSGLKGTEYIIKMNEKLKEDGSLDVVQNSGFTKTGEFQTDKYIKKSDEEEIWQPRFVYHGFRYAQIEGFASKPDLSCATAVFLHTAVNEIGQFSCSDEIINQIQKNTRMATYSNMYGLLTDSPHREKNAWTGDTNVSTEQMLFNYMSGPVWVKWLNDIKDSMKAKGNIPCMVPTAGWGYNWGNGPDYSSVLTWLPDYMYTYYSDKAMICKYYEYMKKNMNYMLSMMQDDVCVNDYGVGDWCAPFEGPAISVNMSSFKAPIDLTDTACMYTMANVLEKFAKMIGSREDAKEFNRTAKRIKAGFRKTFYDPLTGRLKGDGQTCYAAMLYHNLYENDKEFDLIYSHLIRTINEADGHLDYGILGNKYVNNILGRKGRADLIYSMITKDTFPSFAHTIKELGATTLYECWNGEGSRNHHMFGDISATFFKYFAGIRPDPDYPGFKRFTIAPGLNTPLTEVNAVYESMHGTIRSSFIKMDNKTMLEIEVPVNTCAVLKLDIGMEVYEDGNLIGKEYMELESGRYKLEVRKTV